MGTTTVQGLKIFFRVAGKPGNPKLVLLHGFPASSHQYRNLLPALADTFQVLAVVLYPQWQEFLRVRQPRTLIFWGQDDIFCTREGGEAYLQDLPRPSCTDWIRVTSRSRIACRTSPNTPAASMLSRCASGRRVGS